MMRMVAAASVRGGLVAAPFRAGSWEGRCGLGGRRGLSVLGSIQNKVQQTTESRQVKTFRKQIKGMLAQDSFDLSDFRKQLEEGVGHWSSKLPGVRGSDEVVQIKASIKIIEAIKPELMSQPDKIKQAHKLEIANAAGESLAEVERVLKQFQQSHMIFKWVKARQAAGQRIPRNPAEMEHYATDTRGISIKKFMDKPKRKKGNIFSALR
jgi:signal recognition particle GTPase